MINIVNIILLLCLIGCLLYIYWLHNTFNTEKVQKVIQKKDNINKLSEPDNDEISFLKSNYDMSLMTKGTESIFKDDDTSTDSNELDLH